MKGIRKYKTFEDAQFDQFVFKPDKNYFEMIFSMHSMNLFEKIFKKIKSGIYKYKTFEDAQKDEMEWLLKD
jgi:hypothetical protein